MEQEKWRDINIPGLDYKCQVSNLGRVKRMPFERINRRNGSEYTMYYKERLTRIQNCKYQFVQLMVNGKQKPFYVHRLVAEAFIPNPDNLPEVNHKNEDKYDNRVENLEWCTRQYNANYGTAKERMKQKQIDKGKWQDYSDYTEEEKKEAWAKKRKEWQKKNKESLKEYIKKYYKNNKERLKQFRENNKDKLKTWRRRTYERNREHYLDYQKEYYKKHHPIKNHTVYTYDANTGELIGEYKTSLAAGKALGVSSTSIYKRLKEESLKPIKKKFVVSGTALN